MSPYDDDIDRTLAAGLSALAPEVDGADDALASLRPGFRRARTRNRVLKVSGAIVALVAIASVATLAAPSSRRTHVQVSSPSSTIPNHKKKPARTSTTTSTTTLPRVNDTTPTTITSTVPSGNNPSLGAQPTPPTSVPPTTPGTTPLGAHAGGGNGQGRGPTTGTTVPAPENGLHTYQSQGGSIAVRFSHGTLTLVSVSPASGYEATTDGTNSNDIDVRFRNDQGEWRIRVRVEEGRLTSEIGQN